MEPVCSDSVHKNNSGCFAEPSCPPGALLRLSAWKGHQWARKVLTLMARAIAAAGRDLCCHGKGVLEAILLLGGGGGGGCCCCCCHGGRGPEGGGGGCTLGGGGGGGIMPIGGGGIIPFP